MTVYVDNMRMPARVGRISGRWSHLMADTTDELIVFAIEIGLNPLWIQKEGEPDEHYDVTDSKRALAIRMGAKPIDIRDTAALLEAKIKAREEA